MLLNDDGIWICEFSYLPLMLKNLTFDLKYYRPNFNSPTPMKSILINNILVTESFSFKKVVANLQMFTSPGPGP